jgi:hypothetical protein
VSLFGQGGSKKESLIVVVANGRVDEATGEELPVHIPCTCRVRTAPRGIVCGDLELAGCSGLHSLLYAALLMHDVVVATPHLYSALDACVSLCNLGASPLVVVVSLAGPLLLPGPCCCPALVVA